MTEADLEAVLEANQAFYEAFEARDIDAMSELWEHTDRVVCTHPGWATLRGWGAIAGSWFTLFSNTEHLQFIVTNAQRPDRRRHRLGRLRGEPPRAARAAAARSRPSTSSRHNPGGRWRMIGHHGSPILG